MILKIISTIILGFYLFLFAAVGGKEAKDGDEATFWISLVFFFTLAFVLVSLWIV